MQRQRGELVTIGDALSGLGGPMKAIRDDSPQARRGFTQADQVNQLVSASEADPDLGFMARMMALCSLPRSNPGNRLQYKRVNGPYTLIMTATGNYKLPYGNLPRLLMAWISTEATTTQSRVLVLGDSLSEFMRTLGVLSSDSGGSTGVRTRLRNQMNRLFHASVELSYEDKHRKQFVASRVVDRGEFWWDPKRPDKRSLWNSKIELGEKFFQEIVSHPVPLDMNTLGALKRSPLGLDLYLWLVYRTFPLRAPVQISWKQVYRQFGVEPDKANDRVTVDNFRYRNLGASGRLVPPEKRRFLAGHSVLLSDDEASHARFWQALETHHFAFPHTQGVRLHQDPGSPRCSTTSIISTGGAGVAGPQTGPPRPRLPLPLGRGRGRRRTESVIHGVLQRKVHRI